MSNYSIDLISATPCLCGTGTIRHERHVAEYPFGGSHAHYRLACAECEKEWEVHGEQLLRSADRKHQSDLFGKLRASEDAIRSLMRPFVNAYFQPITVKTKQREKMIALKLSPPNIDHYRAAIKAGKTPADICKLPGDKAWLMSLAPDAETKTKLQKLLDEHAANDAAYDGFHVETKPFPK